MNTKIYSIKGIAVLSFLGMAAANKPLSSGAPSASTGAPQEQTCAMSTCHDDNPINLGPAILNIDLPQTIYAGQKVPVKLNIKDNAIVRFGFELTVLDDLNNKAGRFLIKDSLRTQIIGGKSSLPGREYLTYTYYGTSADKPGYSEWEAYWEAPQNPGKVTFYLAGISANNDGEDKGDNVYTTTKQVTVLASLASNRYNKNLNFRVNKIANYLSIENPGSVFVNSVLVTDLNGKRLVHEKMEENAKKILLNMENGMSGIVCVTIYSSLGNYTKKIFLND